MMSFATNIRVRYADTDQMGNIYNGKYFEYFEVGRTEMLRSINFPYRKLEEAGYMLPVLDAYAKFINRGFYDDLLTIETSLSELPRLRMRLNYRVVNADSGLLIAEGYTSHVFVKSGSMKVIRVPDLFTNLVKVYFDDEGD
jgi:acyl-CoA thioester hydrolase